MRKIVIAAFVSMDGVMQAPGGPEEDRSGGFDFGGWTVTYWDEVMGTHMSEAFEHPFDLLLGRKTYDIFAAHWPHIKDDPIAELFNRVTKHVATHSPETLSWKGSSWLGEDVVSTLRTLKDKDGPTLLVQGSSVLSQALLEADIVDQIQLMIFPLVLGSGKKLFGEGTIPAAFKLTKSQASTTGVIMATYERAGDIVTGSFQLDPPTDAEKERREAIL